MKTLIKDIITSILLGFTTSMATNNLWYGLSAFFLGIFLMDLSCLDEVKDE